MSDDIQKVWDAYQEHHPRARLTDERRSLIARRLKDYPALDLILAIDGNHASPFHCGENSDGKTYHDLSLILRNADKIEGFIEVAENGAQPRNQTEKFKAAAARLRAVGE